MELGQRICIFGGPGSGKSTLARLLGQALGLPAVHLDSLYWNPGWVESAPEDMAPRVLAALQEDSWVLDGNYRAYHLDVRLKRATAVIILDIPRLTRMWGILCRTVSHAGRSRADLAPGCPERFDWAFTKFAWHSPSRQMAAENKASAEQYGVPCVVLRSRRQVRQFLQSIECP